MKEQLIIFIVALVLQRKSLVLALVKQRQFFLSLRYNGDDSYLFVNRKEIYKFKAYNKNTNFPTQFCLENISEKN